MSGPDSRKPQRAIYLLVLALTMLTPLGIMSYKLFVLDYTLDALVPAENYEVDVSMQVDGHGEDISVRTFLPRSDDRQIILEETNAAGNFTVAYRNEGLNRLAEWQAAGVEGRNLIKYSYTVNAKPIRYNIPVDLHPPASYPATLAPYLAEEAGVQMNDPLIAQELQRILPQGAPSIYEAVLRIHRHLQDDFRNRNFSGYTDALTALKLGEASCNGKGRLFVAMARKLNIPARLVGGLILNPGNKRTSHQWVELYINGYWVPFDTINDHFAELPGNFLALYYGDEVLFKHTANINFQYLFKVDKQLRPKNDLLSGLQTSSLNMVDLYAIFARLGISQDLLQIVLMIPLGAFVVVVFRNVMGVETFGTFLPALIAAACRQTGLLWGLVGFLFIIVLSAGVRKILDWLHLLHSPKMAVMLTTVVIIMMSLTVLSVQFELIDLAHVTLFPIAILAITAERFAIIHEEQGTKAVTRITGWSMVVIAACFTVMDSIFLQNLILSFPELLLFVIGLNLWLGKWIGMRFVEVWRFRKLIFSRETAA